MLKIFEKQLDDLGLTMGQERRADLFTFLRTDLGDQTAHLDDEALRERILTGERIAMRMGVTLHDGLSLFSIYYALMGDQLTEAPAFKDFFAMPGTTPDDKVLVLLKLMKDFSAKHGGG